MIEITIYGNVPVVHIDYYVPTDEYSRMKIISQVKCESSLIKLYYYYYYYW